MKPVSISAVTVEGVTTVQELEDYQALSKRETEDLEILMSDCQAAISNAEAFVEQLSKQLSVLDGVCRWVILSFYATVLRLLFFIV